jgi:enediyne biosynthesis protein E4
MLERIDYTFYVNTTSSQILWNLGEGNFEWEELPRRAQTSPIKRTIVRDLNADRLPDVILAGNDHSWDVSTGYYDACKGLILMSHEGMPLHDLLTPSESGLVLHGMVESLLWLENGREQPLVVAGFNRDSTRTFRFNGIPPRR